MPGELPSFDLVVATVDRTEPLEGLFGSLRRQTHSGLRVILVDQNEDDRVGPLVAASGLDVLHLRSPRGLSRARNLAIPHLTADVVAFPDDDCTYPDDLLERIARRLAARADLDGVTGRAVDVGGRSSASWKRGRAVLTRENLWNRAISFTMFLRRELVERVGSFDERLGLGSDEPWASGEEIDYLVRALAVGARVEYDPDLTVPHDEKRLSPPLLRARGYRDGASVGYVLRRHRYGPRTVLPMLVRPVAGIALSLARLDPDQARFHAANLRGRITGYREASSSNSSR